MLRILKQNNLAAGFLLLFFTVLLKLKFMMHPPPLPTIEHFQRGMFFNWQGLLSFYRQYPSGYMVLSVCALFLFSLYFNMVINREKFLLKKTYLPAFTFIVCTSFLPVFNVFSTVFVANMILFIAFSKTMQLYHNYHPRRACFDIGMLVSIAGLFYAPSVLFFFLFLSLLLLLRPFVLEENIAYILGASTPVYICFSLLFLTGKWNLSGKLFFPGINLPVKTVQSLPLIIMSLVSLTLLMYGLFLLNQAAGKNAISVRKKWNGVTLYVFFGCVAGIFSITFPGLTWLLAITPICIILSHTFLNNKEKYNTFTFYFLLAAVALVQWLL